MPGTPNRPFFANFFAAFRAHSALQKTSPAPSASSPATAGSSTSPAGPSAPRTITTKTTHTTTATAATAAAVQAAFAQRRDKQGVHGSQYQHQHQHQHTATPAGSPPPNQQPSASSPPAAPPSPFAAARSRTPSATRARRGSNEGLLAGDARGKGAEQALRQEKWYIGGRTAGGEERFYKLGMVRRYTSQDRLSLDRLSL